MKVRRWEARKRELAETREELVEKRKELNTAEQGTRALLHGANDI